MIQVFQSSLNAQTIVEQKTSKLFHLDASGKLVYEKDSLGNRLPDFSYVGYHSGDKSIPKVPVMITLEAKQDDNTVHIQNALDKLGEIAPDKNGIRGALLLKKGIYRVSGELTISHSGIVLRGEGNGTDGTIIIATGYDDFKYKRTLISIGAKSNILEPHTSHKFPDTNRITLIESSKQAIVDDFVPIGGNSFEVVSTLDYKLGDKIVVYRPSTQEWISSIGCDKLEARWAGIRDIRWIKDGDAPGFYYQRLGYDNQYRILKKEDESWEDFEKRIPLSEDNKKFDFTLQWKDGEYDFWFERRITKIEENRIYIDIPIVHSMEVAYGGGSIYHYKTPSRITEVGIENLRLISEFATPTSGHPYGNPEQTGTAEIHAWNGIHIKNNTDNTWVRNITGNYFGWSLISASGKRATIQDCVNLGHASEISGGRRYPFMVDGQLNLVQRCIAFEGRHEFVTQKKTAGPNVFVDCIGFNSKQHSGPHHRYSVGTLYDNVKSEKPMESRFRGNSGTGHGWAGTQTCFYNCVAPEFLVEEPPGGISWVIGSSREDEKDMRVEPSSLYYQQVIDRLGKAGLNRLTIKEQFEHMGEYLWVKERLSKEKAEESN